MRSEEIKLILERLAAANGGCLTPEMVVQEASAEDSPLHDEFEWNDTKAGAAFRLEQARAVIRKVRIEVTVQEHTFVVPAYIRDQSVPSSDQGYVHTLHIRSDADLKRDTFHSELGRALQVLRRVRDLAAVWGLLDDFDATVKNIESMQQRADAREGCKAA